MSRGKSLQEILAEAEAGIADPEQANRVLGLPPGASDEPAPSGEVASELETESDPAFDPEPPAEAPTLSRPDPDEIEPDPVAVAGEIDEPDTEFEEPDNETEEPVSEAVRSVAHKPTAPLRDTPPAVRLTSTGLADVAPEKPVRMMGTQPTKNKLFAPPIALLTIVPWAYLSAQKSGELGVEAPQWALMSGVVAAIVTAGIGVPYALYVLAGKSRQVGTAALVVIGTLGALVTLHHSNEQQIQAQELAAETPEETPVPNEPAFEAPSGAGVAALEAIASSGSTEREVSPEAPTSNPYAEPEPRQDPRLIRAVQRAAAETNELRTRIEEAMSYGDADGSLNPKWVRNGETAALYKDLTGTVLVLHKRLLDAARDFPLKLRQELNAEGCTPREVADLTDEYMSDIRFDLVMTMTRAEYEIARTWAETGRMMTGDAGRYRISRNTGELRFEEATSSARLRDLISRRARQSEVYDSAASLRARAVRGAPDGPSLVIASAN
ncbi:MAG: hypothetical protein AAGB51_14255 [Planctomycetota bacterium]